MLNVWGVSYKLLDAVAQDDRAPLAGKIRCVSPRLTDAQRRRAEQNATPRSADDRSVLVGMDRPATPDELRVFVERENARICDKRDLPPAA